LEDDDLHRRIALPRHDCAFRAGWADGWQGFSCLCPPNPCSNAERGRHCHHGQSPTHKVLGVREAIEQAGAELRYLPPYSPDFNPIENAFSKLKALLRKAAARSRDELWQAIAVAIQAFTSNECANYFSTAGYDCM